ncbi:MAG TPA: hypothetical protein VF546_02065 [Pyrinomonadaceae bacterium]|jgi:hypothetical protein
MNHELYQAALARCAFDACDVDTNWVLAAHVAHCRTCRTELHAWQEVCALLAYAAPPVAPPPDVFARICATLPQRKAN